LARSSANRDEPDGVDVDGAPGAGATLDDGGLDGGTLESELSFSCSESSRSSSPPEAFTDDTPRARGAIKMAKVGRAIRRFMGCPFLVRVRVRVVVVMSL
jgi:hypothetical protein